MNIKVLKKCSVFCAVAFFLTNTAFSCEKWKSEITHTVYEMGYYIHAFNQYKKSNISQDEFQRKAEHAINALQKIEYSLQNESSCEDDYPRFEKRKRGLKHAIHIALPIMHGLRYLDPKTKNDLNSIE